MKYFFFLSLLWVSTPLLAQTNYVATSPVSATPGAFNVIVGTINLNTAMTGDRNVFMGYRAGEVTTVGLKNVFVGNLSGYQNTQGGFNAFLGNQAGGNNKNGGANTFLGNDAGRLNTDGNDNAFVGSGAGFNNLTGNKNTFFGNDAGNGNTAGNNNAFFGIQAGSANTNGSNNTMLGYNAQPTSGTLQNVVAIGYNATVALSNAIVLGDPTNTSVAVGIGTNAPQYPLDVRGIINLRNNGTIKFSHLFNPNLRNGTTDQFLTVDEQGETVLARHRLRIDNVNQWSDNVFVKGYALKPLAQVERHINLHGHLPNIPSAEEVVKEGIDPAKMDAKLLEKIEELTLYSIEQNKKTERQQQEIDELKQLVKQLLEKK